MVLVFHNSYKHYPLIRTNARGCSSSRRPKHAVNNACFVGIHQLHRFSLPLKQRRTFVEKQSHGNIFIKNGVQIFGANLTSTNPALDVSRHARFEREKRGRVMVAALLRDASSRATI
jgi:hypothetical protein